MYVCMYVCMYVTGARKYDHISPVLVQLHWLPVSYWIVFKHLVFVYQSLNDLSELLDHQESPTSLRWNFQDLLMQPTSKTETCGDRAFSVCAPKIWNTVPLEIREFSTVLFFKKKVKTFLLLNLLRVITSIIFLIFNSGFLFPYFNL